MKFITKKLSISLLALSASLIANAETTEGWKDSPNGFDYQSKGLSCKIQNNGGILNLRTPETVLLSKALIHAVPSKTNGEKVDLRVFQSKRSNSIKIKEDGEQKYSLVLKGVLGNKKYKQLATYTQKVILTPEKISFDYEVVTSEPVSLKSYNPFFSLEYAPCSSLKGLGYMSVDKKDKEELAQFPTSYTKSSALRKFGLKKLRIVLPDSHAIFETSENSTISLTDTRSWGQDAFGINIKPYIPYRAKPIDYPVGSSFKWSYSISIEKK